MIKKTDIANLKPRIRFLRTDFAGITDAFIRHLGTVDCTDEIFWNSIDDFEDAVSTFRISINSLNKSIFGIERK